jgi:hypothetical protein
MGRKKSKGLAALDSPEVRAVADEQDAVLAAVIAETDEQLEEYISESIVSVEMSLAEAEKAKDVRDSMIVAVGLTRHKLRTMENDQNSALYQALQKRKQLEEELDANARRVNGVVVNKAPNQSPLRAQLAAVDKEIGALKARISQFYAGYMSVDADEAFDLVRAEDRAFNQSK